MATLWDRFQKAVRWLESTTLAGIVSLPGAEPSNPALMVDAETAATAAPTFATDGIDVTGFKTVDLGFVFGTAASNCSIWIWVYDGTRWYSPEAAKTITAQAAQTNVYVEPFDVESFNRVYVQIVTVSAGTISVYGMPNNE